MKYIKLLIFTLFFIPSALFAASDFQVAAQLLSAAKNADIAQVQSLVNNGANVNYTDSTGLSIVCTALMNNDVRAAQILQMYGADASRCDQQIKQYNKKQPKTESGGLFSGLSSAQSIALAAAGAAVVVGGLFLLTDVFDSSNSNDNGNGSSSGGQCRPNSSCTCSNGGTGTCKSDGTCDCSGTSNPGNATAKLNLPYGPSMPNAASETANYAANQNLYSPTTDGTMKDTFAMMSDDYAQNYLLMMHGYSPLARGYLGMRTVRNSAHEPIPLTGNNLGTAGVIGGRPVNVALVTANGINAAAKPVGEYSTEGSSLNDKLLLWTTTNNDGQGTNGASNEMISSKYYNNIVHRGGDDISILDDWTEEDLINLGWFDFSNSGTAINNALAYDSDDLLAKVVGGKTPDGSTADFIGFMPNGQMTIFRTGGGVGMKDADGSISGAYVDKGNGKIGITLFDQTLTLTMDSTGKGFTLADNGSNTYRGYIGTDGLMYIDSTGSGTVDKAYEFESGGILTFAKESVPIDYANYKALLRAGVLWAGGDGNSPLNSRSRPDIIANASVIEPLRGRGVETIYDILSSPATGRQSKFFDFVNKYYDVDKTDGTSGTNALPGTDAISFFAQLGSGFSPLVIFSTGSFETDSTYSGKTLEATFENSAPLVFANLEHLFVSVVAVGQIGGTGGTTSVTGYKPSGKIALSEWQNKNGTPDDATDDKYYKARTCGIGGSGANGIDPWCFAAAGVTDELAVSSMAGAAGAIASAFSYMKLGTTESFGSKQLFTLLALTADGPYLATKSDGTVMSTDDLKSHLQSMYKLPEEFQFRVDSGGEDYFKVFKEVFGYGLVNLDRATKPTSKIYYYDGTSIVSGSGNAYWRSASATRVGVSSALNLGATSISAPFYDILESSDGSLSLPRIWQNEFAMGSDASRALYMGDVLGEFKVQKDTTEDIQLGNLSFGMSFTEKSYVDSMGGLDDMHFGYDTGNFKFGAGYQRNFTDGASRFDGTANPILSMASNTISSSAEYKTGNWSFGARAFSGSVTDESLLENDPTIASQYEPAKLGLMQGAQSHVSWGNDKFAINASVGSAYESNTVLGTYSDGLLNMGAGNTTYVDALATYRPSKDINLSLRSTFAKTNTNATGEYILGLTDLESNAFSAGADIGNFSFAVSRPLAVTRGSMKYAHAEYEVIEDEDGNFDLVVGDTYVKNLNLSPENREVRFSGSYRTQLGTHTHGAFGFIYRVNPNNTKDFGNESILMMKFSHKVGI